MPAASPVPWAPSVLTLGGAADLLTAPGCPVCRYAAEASDRYLTWFALEAHADPVTIKRLNASLGMCSWHTRQLMSQPGAAVRLTAVYRYVLQAARARLAGRAYQPAACPGCEHHGAAASRALDTVLEDLALPEIKQQLREAGGLCVPHVRAALPARRHRRAAAWLLHTTTEGLRCSVPSLVMLAGGPDHDAQARADQRALLSPPVHASPPGVCRVCAAIAHRERDQLLQAVTGHGPCLCPGHLRDAVLTARPADADLLARQARQQVSWLASATRGRLVSQRKRLAAGCPVCSGREDTARHELRQAAAPARPGTGAASETMCVRHVLALRRFGSPAAHPAVAQAVQRADALIADLAEAFRKGTWEGRQEPMGREGSAWRRAALFLDGGVCGGVPPGTQRRSPGAARTGPLP